MSSNSSGVPLSQDDRISRMLNNIKCVETLLQSAKDASITSVVFIVIKLLLELEKKRGQVDECLLRHLRELVSSDSLTSIDGMAVSHLAKAFLLYVSGLSSSDGCGSMPSSLPSSTIPSPSASVTVTPLPIDALSQHAANHEEQPQQPDTSHPSADTNIKIEAVDEQFPLFGHNVHTEGKSSSRRWRRVEDGYVCAKCGRVYDNQRAMTVHVNACYAHPPSAIKKEAMSTVPKGTATFDYAIRGLRTMEARTCPYCHKLFSSASMVEHHCRKEHAKERREVYGCSECERWCVTVMALVKHWDKHNHCPTGKLMVRDAKESTAEYLKKQQSKEIIYTCSNCNKGFVSRLGMKYHINNVCLNAPMLERPQLGDDLMMDDEGNEALVAAVLGS